MEFLDTNKIAQVLEEIQKIFIDHNVTSKEGSAIGGILIQTSALYGVIQAKMEGKL